MVGYEIDFLFYDNFEVWIYGFVSITHITLSGVVKTLPALLNCKVLFYCLCFFFFYFQIQGGRNEWDGEIKVIENRVSQRLWIDRIFEILRKSSKQVQYQGYAYFTVGHDKQTELSIDKTSTVVKIWVFWATGTPHGQSFVKRGRLWILKTCLLGSQTGCSSDIFPVCVGLNAEPNLISKHISKLANHIADITQRHNVISVALDSFSVGLHIRHLFCLNRGRGCCIVYAFSSTF